MIVYTLAEKKNVCYGHGDYADELQIRKLEGYGTGDFPPIFLTESEAEKYLLETIHYTGSQIVKLKTKDEI